MLQQGIENNLPILIVGPTGTGKTVYTMKFLKHLPRDKHQLIFIGFSAQTTAF
jgi:dynein heavy chain